MLMITAAPALRGVRTGVNGRRHPDPPLSRDDGAHLRPCARHAARSRPAGPPTSVGQQPGPIPRFADTRHKTNTQARADRFVARRVESVHQRTTRTRAVPTRQQPHDVASARCPATDLLAAVHAGLRILHWNQFVDAQCNGAMLVDTSTRLSKRVGGTFVPRISSAPFFWGVIASFARVYTSSSAPQCERKTTPRGSFLRSNRYESRLQSSELRIFIQSTFVPVVQTYQWSKVLLVQKLTESKL
jgi:hypothetical protein